MSKCGIIRINMTFYAPKHKEKNTMYRIFSFIFATLIWLETVYHTATFGMTVLNPVLMIPSIILVAAFETIFVGLTKKRAVNMGILWGMQGFNLFLFVLQLVYYKIFTRPLLLETAFATGGDAITDFWGVALDGIIRSLIPLVLMAVPLIVMAILLHKDILILEPYGKLKLLVNGSLLIAGISLVVLVLIAAYNSENDFYSEYEEFYAPDELVEEYGALVLYGRQLLFDILPEKESDLGDWTGGFPPVGGTEEGTGTETESETETPTETGPVIDTSPNVLNIDFDALIANGNNNIDKMAQIMQSMTPSKKNEYTGIMEGYNLIYITAEAFSPYAVSEELTPTLYKMMNGGVVVQDYYIPLWNTSTSDGEYVNLIGQVPDGQHSFRRTQNNSYPYALPMYFAAEGVKSYAYHNNSLSYYDRYITHPNLGYDFKAAQLGKLTEAEWGSKIFQMENAKAWPNSDYDMMVATVSEWIDDERFYAYYMSLSGHANYSWTGNRMSAKNKELVQHLECSEQMKAYIACNYELERAMTYIVEQLEAAGKLDNTLIVISADHHPYGLDNVEATLEEFTGTEMTALDVQRNCLIMWNNQMEPVYVQKTCSALDILPTIMNLFGFEYDSRLFAGRDMLSDSPSMVVFSNRSFITDDVIYDASTKTVTSRTGAPISDEYISSMKSYVKVMFQYSAGILNYGFDEAVYNAQIKEPTEATPAE